MLVILKIINHMVSEILLGQMAINTLEDGRTEKVMEMELKYGTMEENILETLKMTNYTV